jgi:hypothetical protein
MRTDGTKQLTYKEWSLYYYAPDKAAGQTNGLGAEGIWFAFSLPNPQLPETTTSSTTSSTSTTNSTSTTQGPPM